MSHPVTSQFISDNLSRLAFVFTQQPLKETLCGLSITPLLKKYVYHFTILIDSSPQVKALILDLLEDFINEERIAISLMLSS
jgi:hypothetical protein